MHDKFEYTDTVKEFDVEVSETLSRIVKIKASNELEAVLEAERRYNSGQIVLTAEDMIEKNISFYQSKPEAAIELPRPLPCRGR